MRLGELCGVGADTRDRARQASATCRGGREREEGRGRGGANVSMHRLNVKVLLLKSLLLLVFKR